MEFLVYHSRALVAPGSEASRAILASAVRRNGANGLSGFLHHEPGLFVQYIEGPSGALWPVWDMIRTDRRHCDVVVIGKGLIARRFFPDWRMGYSSHDVASFLDFLQESAGTSLLAEASVNQTVWFLRGISQRVDLGLVP